MAAPPRDSPSSPPASPPGSLVQIIVVWLTGISTWNRTAIALVLGGALLLGLLIYRHPDEVFELVRATVHERAGTSHALMTYYQTDVQRQLDALLAQFGPAMIGVTAWRIDLEQNSLEFVRAAGLPEFQPMLAQLEAGRWRWPVALFRDNAKINDLIARIAIGRFMCATPAETWTEALGRFPIAELCLVAIPSEGAGLGGMLGGAWRTPIAVDDRPRIEMAFRAAADALVWRTTADERSRAR